jgi:hypothetical protein
MKSKLPETNFAPPEPTPMAIIGAILAQGAIRYLDRQKREERAAAQKIKAATADLLSTSSGSALPPP